MIGYALRRLAVAGPLILIVAFGTFGLVYLMPGDAAVSIAGEGASAEEIDQVRSDLGLDRNIFVQFFDWTASALTGDLGHSFYYDESVSTVIGQRIGITLSIVVVGLVMALLVGVPAGIVAGMRPGSKTDRIITALTTIGIAVPAFWLAILLIGLFAIQLNVFNATGYRPITEGFGPWLASLILPAAAVASTSAADIARQTRSSVATVVGQDYIRTARAMGVRNSSITMRHVLRNAGVSIATVAGLQVERLIGAAVVVELLFAMPGLGQMALIGVQTRDIPAIQGVVILIAVIVIVVNLIVDMSYAWINPRLRKR
ncbi:ABC transporter permease subunit [Epidermidibacterium keratini]|uniref:ABC transporter permease subunit n=1 Tax=Epidermidibacterium keratini TaxID=1891644 RepID=A0A7L4YKA5_9ACTN|nr:ABC transporter permease [Epidermidibacterium keratini]QHB99690.1 ABC transporter permease subunit [Epidermidibacterium keratini]